MDQLKTLINQNNQANYSHKEKKFIDFTESSYMAGQYFDL
jgi:hypothetical protein